MGRMLLNVQSRAEIQRRKFQQWKL